MRAMAATADLRPVARETFGQGRGGVGRPWESGRGQWQWSVKTVGKPSSAPRRSRASHAKPTEATRAPFGAGLPNPPSADRKSPSAGDTRSCQGCATLVRRSCRAILVAWLLGVVVLGARLVRGMLLLGSLRRSARPIEAGELGRVPEQVQSALGIGQLPTILVSPRIAGPVAVGVLRPAVILPEGLPGTIGEEALRDILIHECTHIVRRDPMVGLIQRVVELIYWPHPMVHLLNRRLSRTREEACDDIVLSRGDAVAYARTLLAMADRFESVRRPREALALMSPRWKLEERVAGIARPEEDADDPGRPSGADRGGATLLMTTVAVAGVRWGQVAGSDGGRRRRSAGRGSAGFRTDRRSIPGLVVDEAGKPVAGAAVRVLRAAEQPEEAITGPDGTFVIRANGADAGGSGADRDPPTADDARAWAHSGSRSTARSLRAGPDRARAQPVRHGHRHRTRRQAGGGGGRRGHRQRPHRGLGANRRDRPGHSALSLAGGGPVGRRAQAGRGARLLRELPIVAGRRRCSDRYPGRSPWSWMVR